jgi:hypothetical protein
MEQIMNTLSRTRLEECLEDLNSMLQIDCDEENNRYITKCGGSDLSKSTVETIQAAIEFLLNPEPTEAMILGFASAYQHWDEIPKPRPPRSDFVIKHIIEVVTGKNWRKGCCEDYLAKISERTK